MSITPNLGLALPSHGSTNWDLPLNGNFTILDGVVGGNVIPRTINYSVLANNSGAFFTNTGAVGEVDFILPISPTSGLKFSFCVDALFLVKVIATGGAKIRYLNIASGVNGNIASSSQGNIVSIICIGVSSTDSVIEWLVSSMTGAWVIT